MAKRKCIYCGKGIDDNLNKCPNCKKNFKDRIVFWKAFIYLICFFIQCLLCFFLYTFGMTILYSGQVNDLYFLIILVVLLFFNCMISLIDIYKNKKKSWVLVLKIFLTIAFGGYALVCGFNITRAYIYENSKELYMLTEVYDLSVAKEIKKEIDNIFERDNDDFFARDIIIDNFYTDGKISNLYIEDIYGNYKLKFYVDMNGYKIRDVYSEFKDDKLYLVKNGKKTNDFEFYYAMNILDDVLGEDVKGLATIDGVIEEEVRKNFSISANAMFNYEELEYNSSSNTFSLEGDIYNMNYYGDMDEKHFFVTFNNNYVNSNRKVWYYGDSSFVYVNWDVNM